MKRVLLKEIVPSIAIACLIVFGVCNVSADTPVFVVAGKVTNWDGTDAETGLKVSVSNETRGLTQNTTVGEQKAGEYRVNFIDEENKTVASVGDILKVKIRGANDNLMASKSYQITQADINATKAIIDVQGLKTSTPVFVVTGKVTNWDGTDAETGLNVSVSNETRGIAENTTVGEQKAGEYRVNFLNEENKTVAGISDTFKVEIKDAGDNLMASKSYQITQADINATKAVIDVHIPASSTPVFVVTGKVTNWDGTDAETGLNVSVSNETRGLTENTTIGEQKAGEYRVHFIDEESKTVAGVSDILKVEIRGANDNYQITQADINATMAIINVQIPPIVAEIDYPAEDACLSGEVCITGTAEGCSEVLNSWILRRAPKGGQFGDIGSGTEPVSKATLACWDTTKEADGDYTLKLIVYTGEQHNETVDIVDVTVDNTPPQPSITIGENNYTKSNTSISVSGKTEPKSELVSATLTGATLPECAPPFQVIKDVTSDITIDPDGNISGTFTVEDLSEHSGIKLKLCVRDCAGNEGCGFSNCLTVDDEPAAVRILTPANCAYFNRLPIHIAGSAQDKISGVAEVKINGVYSAELFPVDDTTTNWKLDYYPPGEGVYIICASVYDNAGNFFESPDTIQVKYSTGSPAANIISPSDNSEVSCIVNVYGLVDDADADPSDLLWELRAITGTVDDTCSETPCTGTVIASGNAPVYEGLLTQWDTRNLLQGPYTLCLTVRNDLTPVHVRRTNIIVKQPCPVLYGDVNNDGKITAEDASLVLKAVVGLVTLNETQKQAADVTSDGNVTALDAATILQYTVGIITTLPVQK